jgi:putrescine aminotransferase
MTVSPAAEASRFWHPFANMGRVKQDELVLVKGTGSTLIAASGERFLDAAAGLWYCAAGHGRTEIVEAIASQAAQLESCSCFEDVCSQPAPLLADRVARLAPVDDARMFFTSGGPTRWRPRPSWSDASRPRWGGLRS